MHFLGCYRPIWSNGRAWTHGTFNSQNQSLLCLYFIELVNIILMSVYGAKHTHCSDSAVCSYLE